MSDSSQPGKYMSNKRGSGCKCSVCLRSMKQLQQSTQNLSPSAPATPGPVHGSNTQNNGQGGGGGDGGDSDGGDGGGDKDDNGIPLVHIPPPAAQQQRHFRDKLPLSIRVSAGSSASEQQGKSSVSK